MIGGRKRRKKKELYFLWSQSNVAYMYTHVPYESRVYTRVHAHCGEIPCRELHYILLDYINRHVRVLRDILHAYVRYVGGTNFTCVECIVACVRCACTRSHAEKYCGDATQKICIYHWISILLNINTKHDIIRYRYSHIDNWTRIGYLIVRENVTLKSLFPEI